MKKIIEYKILSDTVEVLTNKVNKHLKDGWNLFGPPWGGDAGRTTFQAMIKYSDSPEDNDFLEKF